MRSVILLLVLALLSACGGGDGGGPTEVPPDTVVIEGFEFLPPELTVSAGTTVTWTNQESGASHTSTAEGEEWRSPVLQPSDFFSFTFEEPGRYDYFCAIHPSMRGTITVEG